VAQAGVWVPGILTLESCSRAAWTAPTLHSRELGLHFKWTIEDTMLRRQLRSVHPPEPAVLMNSADARKLEGLRTDCGCRAGGPAVCLALVLYAFWA
jgi:hypothetical protein